MVRNTVVRKTRRMRTGFVIFLVLIIFSVAVAVVASQGSGSRKDIATTAEEYTLTIRIRNEYSKPEGGYVELGNGDSVTINPPEGSHKAGNWVTLKAIPHKYYEFDRWEADLTGNDENLVIEMNRNKTVFAYFRLKHSDSDRIPDKWEINGYKEDDGEIVEWIDGVDDEALRFITDPKLTSTDGDPYTDMEEATSKDMPTIEKPYDHPLVAARPIIAVEIVELHLRPREEVTISDSFAVDHSETWTKSTSTTHTVGGKLNLGFDGKKLTGGIEGNYSYSTTETFEHTIGDVRKWSEATATKTETHHAADLDLSYRLHNLGSLSVQNLVCTFNIYMGDRSLQPISNDEEKIAMLSSGASIKGGKLTIELSIDQYQAIRMGAPLSVEVTQMKEAEVLKTHKDGTTEVHQDKWNFYEDEITRNCIRLHVHYENGLHADLSKKAGRQYDVFVGTPNTTPDQLFHENWTLRDALELVMDIQDQGDSYIIDSYEYTGQERPGQIIFVVPENPNNAQQQNLLKELERQEVLDNPLDLKLYSAEDRNCRNTDIYLLACKKPIPPDKTQFPEKEPHFVEVVQHFFSDDDKMLNINFITSTYLVSVKATVSYIDEPKPGHFELIEREIDFLQEGKKNHGTMYRASASDYIPRWKHPKLLAVEAEDVFGRKFSTSLPVSPPLYIPMLQNRTIYVAAKGDDQSGDGSKDNTYKTIQKGIDMTVDWDTVEVANGEYTSPGNVNLDFKGKAITVKSENGPEKCIINCQGVKETRGFYFHTDETSSSVLEGFTITGGKITGGDGGGIYCIDGSHPTIANCVITENEVVMSNNEGGNGAGIGCVKSSPTIRDCVIRNNKGTHRGGGIYCGDNSNPMITDTIIQKNWYVTYGGGIACVNSSPKISKTIIEGNRAGYGGGGIYCNGSSTNVMITKTVIRGNYYCERGGGIFCSEGSNLTIKNTEITKNRCGDYGGGIYCNKSALTIINATIAGNYVDKCKDKYPGGGIYMANFSELKSMTNTILFDNWYGHRERCTAMPHQFHAERLLGAEKFTNCDVQGNVPGTGNIWVDPKFLDAANGDYHLGEETLCVDGGTYDKDVPKTDLDGRPRKKVRNDKHYNTDVDIGAYEYVPGQ